MRGIRLAYGVIVVLILMQMGCVSLKENALFIETENPNDTVFYISSEIYSDYVTSEGWVTESKRCITARTTSAAAFEGELGIDLTWDKTSEGCPWLGFGFGWDNWTGKDLSEILNIAAIQFHVRMVEGERPNLPWAVGLEDFTGAQAWLGITSNAIKAEKITTEWTRVELPLSEFNWDEFDADASNIKQIIFNTEADGRIYIDEIKIVPYSGGYRKRAYVHQLEANAFVVDGKTDDAIWQSESIGFGSNEVHLGLYENYMCIALKVKDSNPMKNSFSGKEIYNGDAFEIAFSTNPELNTRRKMYMSSDQHIGFAISEEGIKSWDWQEQKELKTQIFKAVQTEDGYVFEAKINLEDLDAGNFVHGMLYGLELAVDHGDETGRITQERWNELSNAGFNENPSLWGEMYIVPQPEASK
jgi:hypothetical protein